MNLLWAFGFPVAVVVAFIAGVVLWARKLQFFSYSARDLDKVDIPNEVREIRINELDALASERADELFTKEWNITRWERRRAISNRHRHIRKWLRLLISNAALFREVARFHIREAEETSSAGGQAGNADSNQSALPNRVLERAVMLQFIAAVCLIKLRWLDCCRLVRPFYAPQLANRLQVRGHDLISWYRHMGKEMLDLTQHYYDDITYTRFIFQLTGVFTLEDAAELNRL